MRIGDREYVERIVDRTDVAERPRENEGLRFARTSALVLFYEREREKERKRK